MMQLARHRPVAEFLNDEVFDDICLDEVEAAEEAIVNALAEAEDMSAMRPGGMVFPGLSHREHVAGMRRYSRCA